MAQTKWLSSLPDDVRPEDKSALMSKLNQLENQSADTNKAGSPSDDKNPKDKMSTSSKAPNKSRNPKGGGPQQYATQGEEAPQARTAPTPTASTPAPGAAPAGSVEEDLQRMEAQQAQSQYDEDAGKIPGGDIREQKNTKKVDPFVAEQAKKDEKKKKKDEKESKKIPTEDLRESGGKKNTKARRLKEKLRRLKKKKKKLKMLAGGLGLGGAFFMLMLLMFLLGALLIPHFVSNMMEYEFLRLTRAGYESTQRVVDEQEADAADEGTPAGEKMEAEYGELDNGQKNPVFEAEDDALTPAAMNEASKVAESEASDAPDTDTGFSENYTEDAAGEEHLDSVNVEDPVTGEQTTEKISGGYEDGNLVEPSDDISTETATAESDVMGILSPSEGDGLIYTQEITPVGNETGATDKGLDPDDFEDEPKGDETGAQAEAAAEAELEEQTYKAVDDETAEGSSSLSEVNNDAKSVDDMADADMANKADVAEMVSEDGNLPSNLINLINSDFVQSALDSVASKIGDFLNPASGKLIPLCIIYMGSKYNGSTAVAQSDEDQRAATLTMAVNDQQKRGSPYVTANMVGAENWKLNGDPRAGGVQDSIPIQRASGQQVNTSTQLSSEGSPLGDTQSSGNILQALGVPFAGQLAGALDAICPAITNIWINLGLGVLNLTFTAIIGIFTGGAGDGAEAGLEAAAEGGAEEAGNIVAEDIVEDVVADSAEEVPSDVPGAADTPTSGFSAIQDFGKGVFKAVKATGKETRKFVITGGLIAMATFLAKFYVMAQSGVLNSGLSTGPQYDDQVDQGTNEVTNGMVANGYGGAPVGNKAAVQIQNDDNKTMAMINSMQSPYQRYLALSNPQSLASIMLDRLAINSNYGFFSSVMADMGNIFNPASLMPQVVFGDLSGQAQAASGIDTSDYGDIQQGYTDQEYALVAKQPSYKIPSENEFYLYQNPTEEATVVQTYSPCFNQSVAQLMSEGDIVTTNNQSEVSQTQGLCSPQNLGPYNPQYGDLVFRYRLSIGYTTTINMLEGLAYANGKLAK